MRKKLLNLFKKKWAYIVSIIFFYVIPIIMLSEIVALTKNVNEGIKITFMGCVVLVVIFFAFRKKIFAIIHKIPHGVARGVLLCLHKGVTYGLFLGILWAISSFSNKFFHWWLLVGVSWLLGLGFLVVNEFLNKEKKESEKD